MKSPFKQKSLRRRRMEARQRAKLIDKYAEPIRLTLIGGGIVLLAVTAIKMIVR